MNNQAESARWPGVRAKLFPVTVLRLAEWSWPRAHFRNWYHGCWWSLSIGPWLFTGGAMEPGE